MRVIRHVVLALTEICTQILKNQEVIGSSEQDKIFIGKPIEDRQFMILYFEDKLYLIFQSLVKTISNLIYLCWADLIIPYN